MAPNLFLLLLNKSRGWNGQAWQIYSGFSWRPPNGPGYESIHSFCLPMVTTCAQTEVYKTEDRAPQEEHKLGWWGHFRRQFRFKMEATPIHSS